MAASAPPGPDLRELLEFDPHWFRRAVHAMGAGFVLYYVLPDHVPWVHAFKRWGPLVLLAAAIAVEVVRMRGGIKTEHFFGLREYERARVSGYVYFGASGVLLLTFFPQSVAVPCIVGAALGDPLVGELRHRGFTGSSLAAGLVFASAVFALAGWSAPVAVLAGLLMIVAEATRFRWLDDDLAMPMLPALVLVGLHAAGLLPLPEPLIRWTLGGGAA